MVFMHTLGPDGRLSATNPTAYVVYDTSSSPSLGSARRESTVRYHMMFASI